MSSPATLDTLARHAGAVTTTGGGARVPAHYGSPAGELAVCIRAVGLGDRSDLGKLLLSGTAAAVAAVVKRATGASLAAGGVCFSGCASWCAAAPDRVIVLCEPAARAHLVGVLRSHAHTLPGVEVSDRTDAWAALAVVGSRATSLLVALGVLRSDNDLRSTAPFECARIADTDVHVLLESDRRTLLLADVQAAERVWRAVAEQGRQFGLSLIGTDALHRFAMLDRIGARALTGQR